MKGRTTFWATPSTVDLLEHLQGLVIQVEHDMDGPNGTGMEPSKITTDWRDDGYNEEEDGRLTPDGHNGWLSIIEWPIEVKA